MSDNKIEKLRKQLEDAEFNSDLASDIIDVMTRLNRGEIDPFDSDIRFGCKVHEIIDRFDLTPFIDI